MSYRIEFTQGEETVTRILKIFERNNNLKKEEIIRWQYISTPGGGHITAFAVTENGSDAAVYSVSLVKFICGGRKILCAQSLDTLTDKGHRGKGLFNLLAQSVYKRCDEAGIFYVYGFPNNSSGPGFFGKLNWINLGYPPFLFNLKNLFFPFKFFFKAELNVYLPNPLSKERRDHVGFRDGWQITEDEYDEIWRRFSQYIQFGIDRNYNYIKWRYLDKPNGNYRVAVIKNTDKVDALVIYRSLEKHGGKIAYIMDLIFDAKNEAPAGELLKCLNYLFRKTGTDVVLAWQFENSPGYELFRRASYRRMPRKIQPIKLNFGIRKNISLADCKNYDFYLSYADSDTV